MGYSTDYINGVIAVKETKLLGEKLLRFPGMEAKEVLRALSENGFGGGSGDPAEEERALGEFIREYAPTAADRTYFLAPRDFHNMKALYKASLLGKDGAPMLAPEGIWSIAELEKMLAQREPPVPEIEEGATGAEIGAAFDKAMYAYLFRACGGKADLKNLLRARVDMVNILTACRSTDMGALENFFIEGGTLKKERLFSVFSQDTKVREEALSGTPYEKFYAACLHAGKTPFTDAERTLNAYETEFFYGQRFDLEGRGPFLYYVFRRRAEIANVRCVLVCLRAGVPAQEIEKRLTEVR